MNEIKRLESLDFKGTGMSCPECGCRLFEHPKLGIANKACINSNCVWSLNKNQEMRKDALDIIRKEDFDLFIKIAPKVIRILKR